VGVKAVFLDRDGTLMVDKGYLDDPDEVELLPTVPEALRLLADNGFRMFVVTNQSGVGRGYFTEKQMHLVHWRLRMLLREENVELGKIYYCPHVPEDNCECRKPKPGLLRKAAEERDVDLKRSYVVGDKRSDWIAGRQAGVHPVRNFFARSVFPLVTVARHILEIEDYVYGHKQVQG